MPQLAADVRISPDKFNYEIGDSVTLSCSEGKELQGEETVMCDPSLNFSPDPKEVKCQKGNNYITNIQLRPMVNYMFIPHSNYRARHKA